MKKAVRRLQELFYMTPRPNQTIVSVPVKITGNTFEAGRPTTLFKLEINVLDYDVAADGQRFLFNTTAGVPPTPLTVATGWAAGLKR